MTRRSILVAVLLLFASACGDSRSHARAIYVLVDTSGTYAQEAGKAQRIVNYLLASLEPGDSLAVARVESRSYSERDIIAKATFDSRPSQANAQKRAFRDTVGGFLKTVRGSRYTDITGGLLQGAEYLNETGAGTRILIVFSDLQEELDRATVRDFPINLRDIRIVAVNVVKLRTDNVDPRLYKARLDAWQQRVEAAGAAQWRVVNDLERLQSVLTAR